MRTRLEDLRAQRLRFLPVTNLNGFVTFSWSFSSDILKVVCAGIDPGEEGGSWMTARCTEVRLLRRRFGTESDGSVTATDDFCLRLSHHPQQHHQKVGRPYDWIVGITADVRQLLSTRSRRTNVPQSRQPESTEPSDHLPTMRSTTALRMFRQTPRMMRPVPVSAVTPYRTMIRHDRFANHCAWTERGPGWYVEGSCRLSMPSLREAMDAFLSFTDPRVQAIPFLSVCGSLGRSRPS